MKEWKAFKGWVKDLFQLRNVIPLLTIIGAFLAVFDIPQNWWTNVDKTQVILVLLGLLALDAFVERLGYLKRIEDSIKSLSGTVDRPLFLDRVGLDANEPFREFLSHGQDFLFVGVSLVATIGPLREFFKTRMQEGAHFRFLLLDPKSQLIDVVANLHGISSDALRSDVESSLHYLRQLQEDSARISNAGSIQFRFLETVLTSGMVVRDGHRKAGVLRCELYLYKADAYQRPAFRITPANGIDYHRFLNAAECLWNDSEPEEMSAGDS